jgi:heme exporter protein D
MAPNLDVGAYGAFIWPAYGLTALVLGWLVVDTLLRARRWRILAERKKRPGGKDDR